MISKSGKVVVLVGVLSLFFTPEAFARFGKGQGFGKGGRATQQYSRKYNVQTVETITGEVVSVNKTAPPEDKGYGIHLVLKTDKETIDIHLGPVWYIENQSYQIQPKDKITVKGSRVTYKDKPIIIAAEIIVGEETLILRDEDGFPLWRGWRRRR